MRCFGVATVTRIVSLPLVWLEWLLVHGNPIYTLHTWLLSRGWHLRKPFVWKCSFNSLDVLDLDEVPFNVSILRHTVRSGWRAYCLVQHGKSKRRDAYCAHLDRFMTFHQIDLRRTRAWSLSCAAARTVSVGASVSPAALDG